MGGDGGAGEGRQGDQLGWEAGVLVRDWVGRWRGSWGFEWRGMWKNGGGAGGLGAREGIDSRSVRRGGEEQ